MLACLHCVGIYNNENRVLNMDSNIYLESLLFYYIKKETYICLELNSVHIFALLNVFSKCRVR